MIISKLISNNVQTALVWQIGSRKVFQFPDKKVLLTLRLYEISLNYRGQRYIKISKTPKDKGKIHKQKRLAEMRAFIIILHGSRVQKARL